jgi:cell division protease FtsH
MGENQELIFLGRDLGTQRNYSEEMASLIDSEVRRLIVEAHDQALSILTDRRANLNALATLLIAQETVEGAALDHLLDEVPALPDGPPPSVPPPA